MIVKVKVNGKKPKVFKCKYWAEVYAFKHNKVGWTMERGRS
jgi:hypothetical protein